MITFSSYSTAEIWGMIRVPLAIRNPQISTSRVVRWGKLCGTKLHNRWHSLNKKAWIKDISLRQTHLWRHSCRATWAYPQCQRVARRGSPDLTPLAFCAEPPRLASYRVPQNSTYYSWFPVEISCEIIFFSKTPTCPAPYNSKHKLRNVAMLKKITLHKS